jgi:short-subunit dehydrogenase
LAQLLVFTLYLICQFTQQQKLCTQFSEALQAENQAKGVKVLAVCPGPTKTQFFDAAGFEEFASGSAGNQTSATPESVVKDTLKALEGQASTVVSGGFPNQFLVNLPRFFLEIH